MQINTEKLNMPVHECKTTLGHKGASYYFPCKLYKPLRVVQKELLIEALRSGQYPQTKGPFIRLGDQYTVLGVMCAVANPDLWNKPYGAQTPYWHYLGRVSGLPDRVREHFGLATPYMHTSVEEEILYQAGCEHTFAEIADWIEANL